MISEFLQKDGDGVILATPETMKYDGKDMQDFTTLANLIMDKAHKEIHIMAENRNLKVDVKSIIKLK